MAKPFGTATPSDARVEYSSPSDAVLPPTSPTSCHPISRNDLIYPDIRMNKSRRIRSVLRKVKAPPAWHRAVAAGKHQKMRPLKSRLQRPPRQDVVVQKVSAAGSLP